MYRHLSFGNPQGIRPNVDDGKRLIGPFSYLLGVLKRFVSAWQKRS
jgi:hypothetical protein